MGHKQEDMKTEGGLGEEEGIQQEGISENDAGQCNQSTCVMKLWKANFLKKEKLKTEIKARKQWDALGLFLGMLHSTME